MTKKRLKELKKIADSGHDTYYCNIMKELLDEIDEIQLQLAIAKEDVSFDIEE